MQISNPSSHQQVINTTSYHILHISCLFQVRSTRAGTRMSIHTHTHMYKHVCEKTCMYLLLNTVWKELEKENKEFFEAYARKNAERATVLETRERIEKILANSTTIRDTK